VTSLTSRLPKVQTGLEAQESHSRARLGQEKFIYLVEVSLEQFKLQLLSLP